MKKYEVLAIGLSSRYVCYCEDDKELIDILNCSEWVEVESGLGEPVTIRCEAIVAFWVDEEL